MNPAGAITGTLPKRPSDLVPDVCGLGRVTVMPASWHARISRLLKVAAIGNGLEPLGLENSLRLLGTLGASRYNPANTRRSMLMKVSRCGDLRPSTLS